MGLEAFGPPAESHENDVLAELIEENIPPVTRELVYDQHEDFVEEDTEDISDDQILEAVEWDGRQKRRQKWLFMAGEMVFQAEQMREKKSLKSSKSKESPPTGLGAFSSGSTDLNWQNCYNEAADAVAIYIQDSSTASNIKDGLQRGTFGEGISIDVPREVLRRLVSGVQSRKDVTVDEVIADHREAVEAI
jgi:hypothetical protein